MRLRSVLGYLGMDVGAVGETQFFPLCRSENFKGPVFIYLFIYLFRVAPMAYEGSQAKG